MPGNLLNPMPEATPILLKNAEVDGVGGQDMLIEDGCIAAIAGHLPPPPRAEVIQAEGGALLPGLTDHHLHLASLAAARGSLSCGPPDVANAGQLARRLRSAAQTMGGDGWLRGIGYHESVAGDIDAAWLDACVEDRPVRIQHRGGRLWVLNSRALACLRPGANDPLERRGGHLTGRLVDQDVWLRRRLGALDPSAFPDLGPVSRELARHGITAVTDTTPHNDAAALDRFRAARADGQLLQSVLAMGGPELDGVAGAPVSGVARGARKFHLLESALPDFDATCAAIVRSHRAGRAAAFHCVTRTELVFALSALEAAGELAGDRIEHASVTPPELLDKIREQGLTVVTQPVFVSQRGDQYLERVAAEDQPWLYRLRAFLEAGVPLAGSSDTPFGDPDPWRAMQAAVSRCTRAGLPLAQSEALTPEQAVALYTSPPERPGRGPEPLRAGRVADLCLLEQPWQSTRSDLAGVRVRLTLKAGVPIWRSPVPAPSG